MRYKIVNIFEPLYGEEGLKTLIFKVPDADLDIVATVKAATEEYLQTDEGQEALDITAGGFNWYDIDAYLPSDICKKHGFVIVGNDTEVIVVHPQDLLDNKGMEGGETSNAF